MDATETRDDVRERLLAALRDMDAGQRAPWSESARAWADANTLHELLAGSKSFEWLGILAWATRMPEVMDALNAAACAQEHRR